MTEANFQTTSNSVEYNGAGSSQQFQRRQALRDVTQENNFLKENKFGSQKTDLPTFLIVARFEEISDFCFAVNETLRKSLLAWHFSLIPLIDNPNGSDIGREYPPSPYSPEFRKCGIDKKGYICDPELILSDQARQSLNEQLLQYPRETPCLCHPCYRNEANLNARLVVSALVTKRPPK
ncbi:unnamed protein product [Trichobilharzia szidati]|nr:unnamed protein product [Trichobilharzia szidati]